MIDAPALGPLVNSAEYDELESELKQIFLYLFATYMRADERDLNVYGAAHLGSLDLLTKRIKEDGLSVFGDDEYAVKYLYRAWNARNPKRGMIFLKTYLQLLWPNGWVVDQMWQTKGSTYPNALIARGLITDDDPETNYYLTSRVRISIDDDSESGVTLTRVSPALRSALAARFLVEIQVLKRFDDSLGIANGGYVENLGFWSGDVVQAFAPGTTLALAIAAYIENIGFETGDMALTLAGKTSPAQDSAFITDQAIQYNERLAQYPSALLPYLGYLFAATFSDSDSDTIKVSAIQTRIDAILADSLSNADALHQRIDVDMPSTGYW